MLKLLSDLSLAAILASRPMRITARPGLTLHGNSLFTTCRGARTLPPEKLTLKHPDDIHLQAGQHCAADSVGKSSWPARMNHFRAAIVLSSIMLGTQGSMRTTIR